MLMERSNVKIFCCYAHRDRPFLDKLLEQLKPLRKGGLIEIRYDADINGGSEREHSIYRHLTAAQIILLLVSPSFMVSESCYKEMRQELVQHDNNAATLIPIL